MKIGFLEVASNKFNGFKAAVKEGEQQANVELVRLPAPEFLKIPVCAKKLFSEQGVDAVMCFIQASAEDDKDVLALVQEKIIDVEVDFAKFVFFCVVLDSEWRSEEQLARVAEQKIASCILEIISTVHEIEVAKPEARVGAGMNMFEQPGETEMESPSFLDSGSESSDSLGENESGEEDIHRLF